MRGLNGQTVYEYTRTGKRKKWSWDSEPTNEAHAGSLGYVPYLARFFGRSSWIISNFFQGGDAPQFGLLTLITSLAPLASDPPLYEYCDDRVQCWTWRT